MFWGSDPRAASRHAAWSVTGHPRTKRKLVESAGSKCEELGRAIWSALPRWADFRQTRRNFADGPEGDMRFTAHGMAMLSKRAHLKRKVINGKDPNRAI